MAGFSRGHFLRGAVGMAGAFAGLGMSGARPTAAAPSAATAAAVLSTAGYGFTLSIEDQKLAGVQSVEGGEAYAEAIPEPVLGPFVKKHLGRLQYEPITMRVGAVGNRALIDWIVEFMAGSQRQRRGLIQTVDSLLTVRGEREFFHALITEVGFPASDGASKDPAYLTVKVAPEYTHTRPGAGKAVIDSAKSPATWLAGTFRLDIDGLDCQRVSRIAPFVIRRQLPEGFGDSRDYGLTASQVEFPNLTITLSEAGAQSWLEWYDDFVIRGNCSDDREKSGRISFLSADMSKVLLQINLHGVGIMRLAPEKLEASADTVRRLKAELYCERMELKYAP